MKLFKILLLALLITGCSTDNEDDCSCTKTTYEYDQYAVIGPNGLPVLTFDKVILSTEQVGCQAEQDQVEQGNGILFDIECN